MAVFHCSVKTVSRSKGRSATAASAYRAGEKVIDETTGEIHDYTKKMGVVNCQIITPDDSEISRSDLWNLAESTENRKNSTVAREWEIALPVELDQEQQIALANEFGQQLVDKYGVAADVCMHDPDGEHGNSNPHAHILTTTRVFEAGELGIKTRILDDRKTGSVEVKEMRESWADLQNQALENAGSEARVDHRSLKEQGIERVPTIHMGPTATAMERRGETSDRGDENRKIEQLNAQLLAMRQQQVVSMREFEILKEEQAQAEFRATKQYLEQLKVELSAAESQLQQRPALEAREKELNSVTKQNIAQDYINKSTVHESIAITSRESEFKTAEVSYNKAQAEYDNAGFFARNFSSKLSNKLNAAIDRCDEREAAFESAKVAKTDKIQSCKQEILYNVNRDYEKVEAEKQKVQKQLDNYADQEQVAELKMQINEHPEQSAITEQDRLNVERMQQQVQEQQDRQNEQEQEYGMSM